MPLQIVYKSVDQLIPYVSNSRTHSDDQITQIASSIKEFGFTNPVLIDENDGVIAGHGRIMAAKKLGLDEVPTITLAGLSDTQRKAYVIADNKLALNADWDFTLLKTEIEAIQALDFNLDLLGFDHQELMDVLQLEPIENATKEDFDEVEPFELGCKCPRCGYEFDE
ncbi:DNA methylase [Moraxella catarrhalis]|uniref:ParB/Srx family N-terminal domain-containing protein n=1 Tax=Moraxella catarrhalis TaxID=480 RepID=UPI000EA9AFDA|nr:ParB/Srx family N-terminal domain-containing protein [Moraxella catarrhalis]RKM32986.1 DNA methylase [Moraxella catarrhalis]